MVSVQPLSSFWSRAPFSKAFTTSHLMMIWENYDIYIRLQLPYSTCCCCLLVASTCYLYLLLLNITCRGWKAIAATFVSSLMERPPAGHTGHTGHSRLTSNRNGPPSLPLWGPNIVSGVHFDWSGSEYVAIVVNKIMFVLITITPGSKVTQSSGALLFVTTIVI